MSLEWPRPTDPALSGVYLRDLAFGDGLVVGAIQGGHAPVYSPSDIGEAGLGIFKLGKDGAVAKQLSTFRCHATGFVTVWNDLVFQGSVESTQTSTTGAPTDPCDRDGLRIIDISDPRHPREVGFVDIPCGVSTHTVKESGRKLYVYAPATCREETDNPFSFAALSEFTVVRVFPAQPAKSRVVRSEHMLPMNACDVFVIHADQEIGACVGDARFALFDLSDPAAPRVIDSSLTLVPWSFGSHTQLAFSWDGSYLAVGDGTTTYRPDGQISVRMYDIEDRTSPRLVTEWSAPPTRRRDAGVKTLSFLPMKDGRPVLSVAHANLGFHLLDLSAAGNPEVIAHYSVRDISGMEGSPQPDFKIFAAHWYNGSVLLGNRRDLKVIKIQGLDRKTVHYFRDWFSPNSLTDNFIR